MDFSLNLSAGKSNRLETTIWAAKLVLLIMGMVSTVILFKVVIVSYTLTFIFSTLPPLLVSARTLLSPPFLYILVNLIIITIAVSSNFHSQNQTSSLSPSTHPKSTDPTSTIITKDAGLDDILHSEPINNPNEDVKEEPQLKKVVDDSAFFSDKLETNLPLEMFSGDLLSPDSDEQRDDIEATWNAIMESQGKLVTLKLKKSETWAERAKAEALDESLAADSDHGAWARRELKKSDTSNDTVSLRREKPMSQEELYRKAEAFIQKINNQMRLQRLESDQTQRFMEMVDGGVSHYYLVESST